MAFETKAEVLQKILSQERAKCPYCGVEMRIWEVPQIGFEEGSDWGAPYLFVCFNNRCPMYMRGWDHIKDNYGHHASYRCICYPGTTNFECMAVFSPIGGTGQIINEQVLAKQQALKAVIKRELSDKKPKLRE